MQQWYQCPRCGAQVAFGARFCSNCQTTLNWPTQPPPQQPAQYQQQPQQQPQQPPQQYQQQYQQPSQYQQQAKPPKKKSNVWLMGCLGVIVLAVIIGAIAVATGNSSPETSSSTPPATPAAPSASTPTPTPTQVDDSIKAGMYKVGTDIQAGEYLLFASSGQTSYLQVSADSSGTLDSIITNDNFNGNMYITVANGQYIEFTKAKMFPVNKAPVLQPVDGKYPEGMYKVGRDIIAGEYKVVSDGGTSYLEVASDSSGVLTSIITNDNFTGEKYITIQDGQYIKLSRCHIVK